MVFRDFQRTFFAANLTLSGASNKVHTHCSRFVVSLRVFPGQAALGTDEVQCLKVSMLVCVCGRNCAVMNDLRQASIESISYRLKLSQSIILKFVFSLEYLNTYAGQLAFHSLNYVSNTSRHGNEL